MTDRRPMSSGPRRHPQPRGARGSVLVLSLVAALVLAGGGLYWTKRSPVAAVPASAAPAPPAAVGDSAPGRTTVTRESAIKAAVGRSTLLGPETAKQLADAWGDRGLSLDALDETALVAAIQGFGAVPPERAEALRTSFERLYAALPPDDGRAAERLLASIRNGTAQPEDVSRAVTLMDAGARRMDSSSRRRLQDQYSAAILVTIASREESERLATIPTTLPAPMAAAPEFADLAAAPVAAGPPAATGGQPSRTMGVAGGPVGSRSTQTGSRQAGAPASRGEAYWRSRAAQLRAAIPTAEARVERAQRELGITIALEIAGCSGPPRARNLEEIDKYVRTYKCKIVTKDDVSRARQEAERAQKALEVAQKALYDLDDEARRDGALPGWTR